MQSRNARIGMVLFGIYLLLYGGFVFINAFAPHVMETMPIPGVNLAILYGFGLIVAALVLAVIYGMLCDEGSDSPDQQNSEQKKTEVDA